MGFKVNTPPVIHQTLEGEVIVVNLESGTYYSIAGTGAEVWSALEGGATADEAIELMLSGYEADRAWVEAAVTRFVDELLSEELIIPGDSANGAGQAASARTGDAPLPFTDPVLNKYTDMQELLMLDPIHEVDEQGWPNRQTGE
jgi:hypothetical protein